MSDLSLELDCLLGMVPTINNMTFRSERDVQDFWERDFDRQLAILQVRALATIAQALEARVDTGTTVS